MKKKIKDLTQEEIKKICNLFDGNCVRWRDSNIISPCPLKCGWKCILKTKAYKIYKQLNEEVEL